MSARLQSKVDNGKGDTLDLAKKINQLQNKIKDVTRKVSAPDLSVLVDRGS